MVMRWPAPRLQLPGLALIDQGPAGTARQGTEEAAVQGEKTEVEETEFFSPRGNGLGAFISSAGVLVVAVCTRRNMTVMLQTTLSVTPLAQYSVSMYRGKRTVWTESSYIYVDGQQKLSAPLKYPTMTEPFTSCCIGSAGHRTTTPPPSQISDPPFSGVPPSARSSLGGILSTQGWGSLLGGKTESVTKLISAGTQDSEWGSPTSLQGQLGSVMVFHEALQPNHVKALCSPGPNCISPFKTQEAELGDLATKLLLHYSPKEPVMDQNLFGGAPRFLTRPKAFPVCVGKDACLMVLLRA
ncbi:neurobeachin-like protein 1 [Salvelinus sp. IW2-2015]|uniref:neurobeachin-like protein 1 n=1 Tax=Salvelinus sp. IW2-2015 TaxID=2691554 RepID=UPI0038D38027